VRRDRGNQRLAMTLATAGGARKRLIEVEADIESRWCDRADARQHVLGCVDHGEVDASAFLRTVRYAARRPSTRTMFSCSANPSRTVATVADQNGRAVDDLTGMLLKSATLAGLRVHGHVVVTVADACRASRNQQVRREEGAEHILGRQAFTASDFGSTSTVISRSLPPYGDGVARPGIVKSWSRMKFCP